MKNAGAYRETHTGKTILDVKKHTGTSSKSNSVSPLVRLKLKAERDRNLSDGAHRALALIISDRYIAHESLTADFAMPWSKFKSWLGWCRSRANRRIDELTSRGYLKDQGIKGCPAISWFAFVFTSEATGCFTGEATNAMDEATSCFTGEAHHISKSFHDKNTKRGAARGSDGQARRAPAQQNRDPEKESLVMQQVRDYLNRS